MDKLGENPATVKKWSSKYNWSTRIHAYNAATLQQQETTDLSAITLAKADWSQRTSEYREQQWSAVQQLLGVVRCYLENVGDQQVEKMTLSQASRALQLASQLARLTIHETSASDENAPAPIQIELTAALKKAYGQPLPLNAQKTEQN